ncbi:MAG: RidA family protein, partial [Dehalococcoidia bacterium]
EQTFANVETALHAAGATMDDVMKITCFLVRASDYKAYSDVREQAFSPDAQPASSTVVVSKLVRPEALIEIEAIAALDS